MAAFKLTLIIAMVITWNANAIWTKQLQRDDLSDNKEAKMDKKGTLRAGVNCRVGVLSVDHKFGPGAVGTYFNFNKCSIHGLQNGGTMTMIARNSRTGLTGEVIVWGSANGGSVGDSHGRFNNKPLAPKKGQWKVGDEIILLNQAQCGSCNGKSCEVEVLSVDHKFKVVGKYFNFNKCSIHGLQTGGTLTIKAKNSRTGLTGQIIVWGSANGGSIGDSHGRFNNNPVSAQNGQWKVGDKIILLNQPQCGKCVNCRVGVLSVDHKFGPGVVGKYFNFNKCSIHGLYNGDEMTMNAKNSRTGQTGEVIVWGSANGGSVGDSHGRFNNNPIIPNKNQWKVGDGLILLNQAQCAICCQFAVLSVDHKFGPGYIGQYFNFNHCSIHELQNGETLHVIARNSRTGLTGEVVIWGSTNGGSIGDSHGRFNNNPVPARPHQWRVGDKVILLRHGSCGKCP